MNDLDTRYASSHWRMWGARNTGYGTQRRSTPADWAGVPLLALTSPERAWALRHLPLAWCVSRRMGLAVTQDTVRQVCTVALLRTYLPAHAQVLIIGDGFGVLAGLLKQYRSDITVHLVDLSFALEEQRTRLIRAFGPDAGFTFSHAGALEQSIMRHYDLAVNVASMQEMDPPEVQRYFHFLRGRAQYFYCCNRERKVLPDGTVSAFADYPWSPLDTALLDGLCPWHQWFLSHRPPFVHHYNGPTRHRLVRMAPHPL
jgi:hypothetical protein